MGKVVLGLLGLGLAVLALGAVVVGFQQGDPIALLVGVAFGLLGWWALRRAGVRRRRRG